MNDDQISRLSDYQISDGLKGNELKSDEGTLQPFKASTLQPFINRRAFIRNALAVSGAAAFGGAMPAFGAARETRTIRTGTLVPDGTSIDYILKEMGNKWKTAGLTYQPFLGGTMGGETDVLRRVVGKQLDAAVLMSSGLARIDRAMSSLQLVPMVFRSLDEVEYVCERLFPTYQALLRKKNYELLFLTDAGWIHYFTTRPGLLPDDFKKLKMFASIDDKDYVELITAAGFRPVPLAHSQTLSALSTGMIEALAAPPFYANALLFYTKAPYMLALNWVPLTGGMVIHSSAWATLSSEKQEFVRRTANEAAAQIRKKTRAEADDAVTAMKKRKLTVHEPTPKEIEAWENFATALHKHIRGKLVPAETFDQVQHLVRERRGSGKV